MNHLLAQLDERIAGFPVCRNAPRAADLHGFRTACLEDIQRQQEGVRPIKKTHVQFGDIRPVFGLPCLETSVAVDPLLCRQLRDGVVRLTPRAHGTEHEGFPLVETRLRESQDIADCQCLAGGSLVTGQAQLPGHSVESGLAGLARLGFSMCTIGVRLLECTVGRRLNAHIQLQQGLRGLAGQFGFREFNATLFRRNQLAGRIRGRGLVLGGCMVQQGCQDHVRANFSVVDQFAQCSGGRRSRCCSRCCRGCCGRCCSRCCSGWRCVLGGCCRVVCRRWGGSWGSGCSASGSLGCRGAGRWCVGTRGLCRGGLGGRRAGSGGSDCSGVGRWRGGSHGPCFGGDRGGRAVRRGIGRGGGVAGSVTSWAGVLAA